MEKKYYAVVIIDEEDDSKYIHSLHHKRESAEELQYQLENEDHLVDIEPMYIQFVK